MSGTVEPFSQCMVVNSKDDVGSDVLLKVRGKDVITFNHDIRSFRIGTFYTARNGTADELGLTAKRIDEIMRLWRTKSIIKKFRILGGIKVGP